MQFISDYRSNAVASDLFFKLARSSFGLDLAGWAARGNWDERYTCYSLIDAGMMVANVSATRLTLLINGRPREALQLGTVCTRPEYRGKGCARQLLSRVIDVVGGQNLFLFSNPNARGLYEKLGFAPAPRESVPYIELAGRDLRQRGYALRRTSVAEAVSFAARNSVYSSIFDVRTNPKLAELYIHDFLSDALYVSAEANFCVIYELESGVCHVRALFGERACDPERLIATLAATGTARAEFDFMPDGWGIRYKLSPDGPDETFTMGLEWAQGIAYPGIMRA